MGDDPPGAERLRQLERVAPRATRPTARAHGRDVARDDDVEIGGRGGRSSRSRTAPPTSHAGIPSGLERRQRRPRLHLSLTGAVTVVAHASPGREIPQITS